MKTSIYYFLFFSILTIQSSLCQTVSQPDVTGVWTVTQATMDQNLSAKEKQMMELMKKGFVNSTFQFKADGKFFIVFPKDAPAFMEEMKFLNNQNWIFNQEDQLILIGTKADNYSIMQLYVKKTEGKYLFVMSDTPMILEMVKKQ